MTYDQFAALAGMNDLPTAAIGTLVRALVDVLDPATGLLHARRGEFGVVIDLRPGYCPTVRWHGRGTVCDVEFGTDVVAVPVRAAA